MAKKKNTDLADNVAQATLAGIRGAGETIQSTLGGSKTGYIDPAGYAKTFATAEEALKAEQDYLGSLEEQQQQLRNMPGVLQQAFETGKQQLQGQVAQSLASQKNVARGGRGLAAAGSVAAKGGEAIARREAESKSSQAEALSTAAKGKTALIGEYKKVAENKLRREAEVGQAKSAADAIIEDEKGTFFTTDADRRRMRSRFQNEIATAYAGNPAALKAALDSFNTKVGGGSGFWMGAIGATTGLGIIDLIDF